MWKNHFAALAIAVLTLGLTGCFKKWEPAGPPTSQLIRTSPRWSRVTLIDGGQFMYANPVVSDAGVRVSARTCESGRCVDEFRTFTLADVTAVEVRVPNRTGNTLAWVAGIGIVAALLKSSFFLPTF